MMDEGKEESVELLNSFSSENRKVESASDVKPEESPGIEKTDVTRLRNNSDAENIDECGIGVPVDARHLDSVFKYTSKIRAFIGLVDPEEDSPSSISSPLGHAPKKNSTDECNKDLEVCGGTNENLPETHLNSNENDTELTEIKNGSSSLNESKTIGDKDGENDSAAFSSESIETSPTQSTNQAVEPLKTNCETSNENESSTEVGNIILDSVPGDAEESVMQRTVSSIVGGGENALRKHGDFDLSDDTNVIPAISNLNYEMELKEILVSENDLKMSADIPCVGMNGQLLEADNISSDGNNLADPEDLIQNELIDTVQIQKKDDSDDKTDSNSNISQENVRLKTDDAEDTSQNEQNNNVPSVSIDKPEEEVNLNLNTSRGNMQSESPINSDENKSSEILDEQRKSRTDVIIMSRDIPENSCETECENNNSTNLDTEVKERPPMDAIRRLSLETVNKVLDTARNQLREMLNEKRISNAGMNNLTSYSNLQNCSDSQVEIGNVNLNFEFTDDLQVDAKGNLGNTKDEEYPVLRNLLEQPKDNKLNNEIQLKEVLSKTYDLNEFQKKIEVEMNKFDPRYDLDPDIICGIGCFKPKWIQPWATSRVYLILYSIIGILSGSYYSYLISCMSTLEKRFAFKSKTSGLIMMLDEITPLILGVFVGYFGGKAHRPRMVGLGMLLSSICCFVSALPYFIYGPGTHLSTSLNVRNETELELCNSEIRQEHCDSDDRPPTLAAILFLMLGSFLKGFGNLAYYAVGLAYMDDNAKKKNTPMYFAVAFALRLIGPMVGFLMSSFFLKYYENPFVDPGFEPEDPRWIGCWWMGFLVQGVLLLIFTVPISLFPRRLPGTIDYSRRPESENQHSLISSFTGLGAALKRLAKNPLYLLINLNTIFFIFGAFGHYILLPKYMENQFKLSASNASLLSGPPSISSVIVATLIGGYLIWKFKPSARFLTAGMVALETIAVVGFLLLMIPRCRSEKMSNFGFSDEGLILENQCNTNCNCSRSAFTPVCGPDKETLYFSPCYAGCSQSLNETFVNCSCVLDPSGQQRHYVTEGLCAVDDCWSQALAYIVSLPILSIFVNLLKVAHTMVLLRSIHPEDKSVALGAFETFICTFGFIPYPVFFGALVDSACLVWEKSCGETGNCWFYDVSKFNYLLHGSSALFSAFSALTLLAIFFLSGRVHELYEEDSEVKSNASAKQEKAEASYDVKESKNNTNF